MRPVGFGSIVAAVLLATQLAAQTPQANEAQRFEISFGVSGNPGPEDDFNPLTVAYKKWPGRSTQVLGFINYCRPRTLDEIEKASGIPHDELEHLIADLQKCGLIAWSAVTGYRVTFAVFDDELWKSFDPIMDAAAEEIARRVVSDLTKLRSRNCSSAT